MNSSQINQRMLTRITVNNLLQNWTGSTENNLVSLKLSLIITDQGYIIIFSFLVKIFEQQLKMVGECVPVESSHHLDKAIY